MVSFPSSVANLICLLKSPLNPYWLTARAAVYRAFLLAELAILIVNKEVYLNKDGVKDGYEDIVHVGRDLPMTAVLSNNYCC
jgi:hypothetical protein